MRRIPIALALVLVTVLSFAVVTPAPADLTCTRNPEMFAYANRHADCSQSGTCQSSCNVAVTGSVTGFGLVGVVVKISSSSGLRTASCGPSELVTCRAQTAALNAVGHYVASCRGTSLLAVREMIFCNVSVSAAG